jgi:hypothetical protein
MYKFINKSNIKHFNIMKIVKYLLTTATIALFVSLSASAQTASKEDLHKKLTTHHTETSKHATEIHSGTAKTTAEQKTAAVSSGKNLEEAKKSHQELKASVPASQKTSAKVHHDAIDKHHTEATAHHKVLTEELAKPTPDNTKVKMHAKSMDNSMKSAETEHQALKTATPAPKAK